MDLADEWVAEVCGNKAPDHVLFGKLDSEREALLGEILGKDSLSLTQLVPTLNITKLLKNSESSKDTPNIQFLIDQITDAKKILDTGKGAQNVPQNILADTQGDLDEFAQLVRMQ